MGEPILPEYICSFEFRNYEKDQDLIPGGSEFRENQIEQGAADHAGGYPGWIMFRTRCCFT